MFAMAKIARLAALDALFGGMRGMRQYSAETSAIETEVRPYLTHQLDNPPDNKVSTTKKELLDFFEIMYRIRRMEVAADMLYKAKMIRGFCHLYDGQEAVAVGIAAGSTYEDSLITAYRDHGFHLTRGGSVKEVMGELLGRECGAAGGVGGSMHLYNKANGFYGGSGIVGEQIPIGAGLGLAHKMRGDGHVSFSIYGDGAANQGQMFEAINMCALWKVPCIFVCENNHYGMGTADWRGSKAPEFYKRGDYIPGIKADGMDVLAVKKATQFCKAHALERGPIILEADTYRFHGHSMSDPGASYRTRDEIKSMRQERDPLERVRKLLLERCGVEAGELKALEKRVKSGIDGAIEESKAAAEPGLERLAKHIYKAPLDMHLRGATSGHWVQAT